MHPSIVEFKTHYEAAVEHLRAELNQLRTGRATPALVEDLTVDAYGAPMAVRAIASISVQDARTLAIEPWDKNMLKPIEKAIQESGLGINPVVDSKLVRLAMPAMTEESRKNLVKLMKEKLEDGRVAVRGVREKARETVMKMEKENEMSEDEKFKNLEELEEMTKGYIARIESMGEQKEEEIMTV